MKEFDYNASDFKSYCNEITSRQMSEEELEYYAEQYKILTRFYIGQLIGRSNLILSTAVPFNNGFAVQCKNQDLSLIVDCDPNTNAFVKVLFV